MADVSVFGAGFINYYSHIICRTRSGRLYAGGAVSNLAHWSPAWTYSDDNGSTWATPTYFNNMRPTWAPAGLNDYIGQCMAVDGGDNVHCAWRDADNFLIWYTQLQADRLGWTTPKVIGTNTVIPHPPKVVIGSDNSVNVLYTQGTEAVPATGWCVTSLDSGSTWKTRGYTQSGGGSVNIAGPMGACADNAGLIHVVYTRTDGTQPVIRYTTYDPSTQTFANDATVSAAGHRAIEPDIAIGADDSKHITYAGIIPDHEGHLSFMYARYTGGAWQVSELLHEPSQDVRQTAVSCSFDPIASGSTGVYYVYCCARIYIDATSQYEIRGTYAIGPNYNLFSALTTYSDNTIANNKAYTGLAYQRYPHWMIPRYGFGLSYLVETNYDFRYTSWEGIIGSSTPAVWNPWYPVFGTIKPLA